MKPNPKLTMEDLAQVLKQLKDDQKQFKKDHKDVFDENRAFNKKIKEASDALIERMKSEGVQTFQHDGTEFEVKVANTEKHDTEKIAELVGDEDAFSAYMAQAVTEKPRVLTRRSKKQKTEN